MSYECVRQLEDIKTYLELMEKMVKDIILEVQNKIKRRVESHMYKGNCTKKWPIFECQKCIHTIFHIFILFGKSLQTPLQL